MLSFGFRPFFLRGSLWAALALWAGAHALGNATLAHVIMFGSFAGFAVMGGQLIDRRRQREMGAESHQDWLDPKPSTTDLPRVVALPDEPLRSADRGL